MREILGKARPFANCSKEVRCSVDYYRQEYKWHEADGELVDDLSDKFLEEYQPGHAGQGLPRYPPCFLGSIVISKKENVDSVVDGQQRLTRA
ncbi:MAG: DUF262 domain-containing protein [Flavobacteriales bacterium]|nr:DUF262 domain-containing protein [Flavobacteriales bacterium]